MMSIELVESSFGAVMNFEVISSEISFYFIKLWVDLSIGITICCLSGCTYRFVTHFGFSSQDRHMQKINMHMSLNAIDSWVKYLMNYCIAVVES